MSSSNPYLPPSPINDDYDPQAEEDAAMDVEDEFEGAQWIDGEFYYTRQRQKKHQTKHQQVYGIFAGDSEEDSDTQHTGRTPRGQKKNALMDDDDDDDEEEEQQAAEAAGEEEEEESPAVSHSGLGLGRVAHRSHPRHAGQSSSSSSSSSSHVLSRTMKFVSAGKVVPGTQTHQEQLLSQANKETENKAAAGPETRSSTAAPSPSSSVPMGFKRRRLEARQQIEKQKQSDEEQEQQQQPAAPTHTKTKQHKHRSSPAAAPTRPVIVDEDFGSFTRHSTGVAWKMLSKMGFRGRLGKNETGVANPIIAKVRPKNAGLGVIKEGKGGKVARNAEEEEKIAAEKEAADKKKAAAASAVPSHAAVASYRNDSMRKSWKKGSSTGKRVYKTAAQVLQSSEQRAVVGAPTVIVDMTSGVPIQRAAHQLNSGTTPITTTSTSSSTGPTPTSTTPSAIPELQHNIQLLVDLTEVQIQDLDQQMKQTHIDVHTLSKQQQQQQQLLHKQQQQQDQLQSILLLFDEAQQRLSGLSKQGNDLYARLSVMDELMAVLSQKYRKEYQRYAMVMQMCVALVLPMLKALLHGWEPVEADANDQTYSVLHRWRHWLDGESSSAAAESSPSPLASAASSVLYHQLIDSLMLPKLRLTLSNPSLSIRDVAPILRMFAGIQPVLPASLHNQLITSLFFPRLLHEVKDDWNPRTDSTPIDSWLLAYTAILSETQMQSLYSIIRSKFSTVLSSWKPIDTTVITVISPWVHHWKSADMEAFLHKTITPKLTDALKRLQIEIPTAAPELAQMQAVLLWYPLYAPAVFLPFLLNYFFPHWFMALYEALTAAGGDDGENDDVDYASISAWYVQWKGVLGDSINSWSVISECWKRALDLINVALTEGDTQQTMKQITEWIHTAKLMTIPAQSATAATTTSITASTTSSKSSRSIAASVLDLSADSTSLQYKDVLAQLAALHGLSFFPHPRRLVVSGGAHDTYLFADVSVYWVGQTVFALDEKSKEWKMISLTELLQRAKAQAAQQ